MNHKNTILAGLGAVLMAQEKGSGAAGGGGGGRREPSPNLGAAGAAASDAAGDATLPPNGSPATKSPLPATESEVKAKEEAARLDKESQEAAAFAAEAAADAAKRAQAAAAARAIADGKVLVLVPSAFNLNHAGLTFKYGPGSYPMPKEHAEHSYARANGVQILGVPAVPEPK